MVRCGCSEMTTADRKQMHPVVHSTVRLYRFREQKRRHSSFGCKGFLTLLSCPCYFLANCCKVKGKSCSFFFLQQLREPEVIQAMPHFISQDKFSKCPGNMALSHSRGFWSIERRHTKKIAIICSLTWE